MVQPDPPRKRTVTWIAITVLLLASLVGMLWVPFYARETPKLGDFPFFYWYQLIWVPIVAVLSWLAVTSDRPPRKTATDETGPVCTSRTVRSRRPSTLRTS